MTSCSMSCSRPPTLRLSVCRVALASLLALFLIASVVPSASAGSNTWTRIGLAGKGIDVVAVAPTNPNLLIATVETDGNAKMYRSADRGKTWRPVTGLPANFADGYRALKFDPQNANIVYVFGMAGLMRSDDGGKTWTRLSKGKVGGFAIDAKTPSTIYLCGSEEESTAVMRSTDRGRTWRQIGQSDVDFSPVGPDSSVVAVDPSDPNLLVVSGVIYQSTDGGTTWKRVPPPSGVAPPTLISVAFSRDGRALFGLEASSASVLRSLDDGLTWQTVLSGPISYLLPNPRNAAEIFAIGPGGRTIFRSTDAGTTFSGPLPPPADDGTPSHDDGNPFFALDQAEPQTLYGPTRDGVWAYTFGEAPVSPAETLPKTGSPDASILGIIAVLAVQLSLIGLRLRVARTARQ